MLILKRKRRRKSLKKIINILLISVIIIIFTMSGYDSKKDINDLAYVVAIGVDIRRAK